MARRLPEKEVLTYRPNGPSRATVHGHYKKWREDRGLPKRCDAEDCIFHTAPLEWNGKPLKPILDHINGNNSDNRPDNLRLLCPNCDSQLTETRGGANKGRIEKSEGGFAVVNKDRLRGYTLTTEAGSYELRGAETAELSYNEVDVEVDQDETIQLKLPLKSTGNK